MLENIWMASCWFYGTGNSHAEGLRTKFYQNQRQKNVSEQKCIKKKKFSRYNSKKKVCWVSGILFYSVGILKTHFFGLRKPKMSVSLYIFSVTIYTCSSLPKNLIHFSWSWDIETFIGLQDFWFLCLLCNLAEHSQDHPEEWEPRLPTAAILRHIVSAVLTLANICLQKLHACWPVGICLFLYP